MRNGSIVILVDTNVVVYAYDASETLKQPRARLVLSRIHEQAAGALTVQVLNEFFVTSTRRIVAPLTLEEARQRIVTYVTTWPILHLTPQTVLEAVRGVQQYQLAYWDALLWASARLNGIPYLLSEDGPTGATIEGVRYVNPFVAGFDIEALLPHV